MQKSLIKFGYQQNAASPQNLLGRVISHVLIACTVLLLVFFAIPEDNSSAQASTSNILVAFQSSETNTNLINTFRQEVKTADPNSNVVVDVTSAITNGMALITVNNTWQYLPYQTRRQATEDLWKIWAATYSPDTPDSARVKIVDLNGNRVGGSSVWGGSVIDVDK